jgi:hypothetical protein
MTNGAIAAGAAAAAAARRRQQEEEEMTSYSPQDLAEGVEFKILRANTRVFRRREVLQRVLEEERQSGWVLVEKFDDARLRFKRPLGARSGDATRTIDAYRSHYGMSEGTLVAIILGSVFGTIALVLLVVAIVKNG